MTDRPTYDIWFARLEANPEDDEARAVFADLAREWGDEELAEWLRLEQLHRQDRLPADDREAFLRLSAALPGDVRARISGAEVQHCAAAARSPVALAFACPMRWERMQATEDPRVRVCGACVERVHWVDTLDEADAEARAGRCIAIAPGLQRSPGGVVLPPGHVEPLFEPPVALAGKPAVPESEWMSRILNEGPKDETRKPWWRRLFGG